MAADHTWSGGAASGTPEWSNTSNWGVGSAPITGEMVGTLSFPDLGSCDSLANTCYRSTNDVGGLTVNRIAIDDGSPYIIDGNNGITLTGGITASTTSSSVGGPTELSFPIALGAPNTWSIDGSNGGRLAVLGNLTGSPNMLSITATNNGFLDLAGNDEVGAVTITGQDPTLTGINAGENGGVDAPSDLNGTNGNPVSLTHAELAGSRGTTTLGPLTSTGGRVFVPGLLEVHGTGTISLDSNSAASFLIKQAGTTPGTDYGQLSATGNVDLGNSELDILPTPCSLNPGDVDTIVTTAGSLMGTFAGVPDNSLVTSRDFGGCQSTFRINYNRTATPRTVTATVVSSGPSTTTTLSHSPTNPVANQTVTLTATVTASSGTPAGTVEFDANGAPISGCTARPLNASGTTGTSTCQTSFAASSSPYSLDATFSPSSTSGPQGSSGSDSVLVGSAPPPPPPPSATAPASTAKPAVSGSPVAGRTLSCSQGSWSGSTPQTYAYQWLRSGGAIAGATRSTYTVTAADAGRSLACRVTASNSAGSASATSASVNVPPPPSVSRLRISPTAFFAAPRGPSATASKRTYGAKVTFKLNEAAKVRFTVRQAQPGRRVVRSGKARCVAPTRSNRTRPRCTRTVTLRGSVTRSGRSGSNSFRFTGRIGGRTLKPGTYTLVATPTGQGLRGRSVGVRFKIRR